LVQKTLFKINPLSRFPQGGKARSILEVFYMHSFPRGGKAGMGVTTRENRIPHCGRVVITSEVQKKLCVKIAYVKRKGGNKRGKR
jgi:hypothetical protein